MKNLRNKVSLVVFDDILITLKIKVINYDKKAYYMAFNVMRVPTQGLLDILRIEHGNKRR